MTQSLNHLPLPLARVVESLTALPGIGRKSALRLGLHFLSAPASDVQALCQNLQSLKAEMDFCGLCGCFAERGHCQWCERSVAQEQLLCVVEQPVDVLMLERGGRFAGRFHVLGGRLSPVDGIGVDQLSIQALDQRLREQPIKELLLASSATVDGDATAHFLLQRYADRDLLISRIARGVPEGGELEYLDEHTLQRALEQRVRWR